MKLIYSTKNLNKYFDKENRWVIWMNDINYTWILNKLTTLISVMISKIEIIM